MDFKIESSFKLVAAKNYPTQRERGRIEGGVGGREGERGRVGGRKEGERAVIVHDNMSCSPCIP